MSDQRLLQEIMPVLQRGHAAQMAGDLATAESCYRDILARDPNVFDALQLLGLIEAGRGRFTEAEVLLSKAVALNPRSAQAASNLGNVLSELGRAPEALAAYDTAIANRPDYVDAHSNRALLLQEKLGRLDEAMAGYERALSLNPNHARAQYNRANCLRELKRFEEAVAAYDRAVTIVPDYVEAWCNRGNALMDLGRLEESLASYSRALQLDPNHADALNNRGSYLMEARQYEAAAKDFEHLEAIAPDYAYARGLLMHARMHCCNWDGLDGLVGKIEAGIREGKRVCNPFSYLAVATDPLLTQKCAQIHAQHLAPARSSVASARRAPNKKIRVGYLSGEFRAQATSYLMAGVYEHHDKTQFEIYAFDNGSNDGSPTRSRMEHAFDQIIDIRRMRDDSAAHFIAGQQIDILVNLNGYFGLPRNGVFAHKPAPIQVNYLGFPATIGAPYIDYLIADKRVLPESDAPFFDEKIVYLPDCYQANDDKRAIGIVPTRESCGLPEDAVVFASFNNSYKYTPALFDVWMRILNKVPGSVLWLLESNRGMAANLRREAQSRGVTPERLVFAPSIATEDHLARQSLANIFLDALPYNAHTTASDALWAGLPVVTCKGSTFPGRVASSLLETMGMGELVTATVTEYEALASRLGNDKDAISALKTKLRECRALSPLFQTERFTRHLEAAYRKMWERHQNGLTPESFSLAPHV